MVFWWEKDLTGKQLAARVKDTQNGIEFAQYERLQDSLLYASLYGNVEMSGFGPHEYALSSLRSRFDKMSVNLIHNMVDTVAAKLCAPRIKPAVLTEDGDYLLQRRAKKLGDAIYGVMYENDFVRLDSNVIKDAAIFGMGYVKVVQEDGKVCIERVLPTEIFVDNAEAMYGKPPCMYQVRHVSRDALRGAFPKLAAEIDQVEVDAFAQNSNSDVLKVIEAWKVGKGGRHVMTVGDVVLVDEKFNKPSAPFAWFSWNPRTVGFYAEGLAEQLIPLQVELNKLLRRVQISQHLMSVPYLLVENGSKVNRAQLTNEVGHVVNFTGRPPTPVVGQAMHPEVYQHIDRIIRWAYEVAGISQLSAQSKKPAGLDSEPALRTFHDFESERFQLVNEMHEQFVLQLARLIVQTAREIPNYTARGINKQFFQSFSWKDIDLKDSEFVLKIHPTSMLPTTPSARIQKVMEMFERGMVTPVEAMELLEFPDTDSIVAKKTVQLTLVKQQLGKMEETGKLIVPEPFQDLQLCLSEATAYYGMLKVRNAPESVLSVVRKFIRACDEKLSAVTEAAQGAMQNVPVSATLGAIPAGLPTAPAGLPPPGPAGASGALPPGLPPIPGAPGAGPIG